MQNLEAAQALQNALGGGGGGGEGGHLSDTTASAPCSDDEGSTAATDGSTLRTSPAEQAGSESGGSGAESFELYARPEAAGGGHEAAETRALLVERLLLEKLIEKLPALREVAGVQAIPFLQVCLIQLWWFLN